MRINPPPVSVNQFVCPICGSNGVAIVSGIYASTQKTALHYGGGNVVTMGSSMLGRYLAPPRLPSDISIELVLGILLWLTGAGAAMFLLPPPLGFFEGIDKAHPPSVYLKFGMTALVFLSGGVFFLMRYRTKYLQKKVDKAKLEVRMVVWDRLLYCSRCDTLYDPLTRVNMKPFECSSYLSRF